MDKVYAPKIQELAWEKVQANRGAAGVDGQSVEKFAAQAEGLPKATVCDWTDSLSDGRILDLIRGWLEQDIVSGLERWTPTGGTPQGAVISPLLANVYLHPLDLRMMALEYRMVRYADDFVVLCRSAEEAQAALSEIRVWVDANGLSLHPDKTCPWVTVGCAVRDSTFAG